MKSLLRIIRLVILCLGSAFIWAVAALAVCIFTLSFLCGCRSVDITELEAQDYHSYIKAAEHYQRRIDSLQTVINNERNRTEHTNSRDTVIVRDSVSVRTEQRGDTVYITSEYWHNRYQSLQQDYALMEYIANNAMYWSSVTNKDSLMESTKDSLSHHDEVNHKEVIRTAPPLWESIVTCIIILIAIYALVRSIFSQAFKK